MKHGSSSNPATPVRLNTLDYLRGLAALAVVLYHYTYRGPLPPEYLNTSFPELGGAFSFGYLAVQLFFMISGFVIAMSLVGRSPMQFAWARFLRLWPTFVICMTLTFLVTLASGGPSFPASIPQYLANLTFFAPAFSQPFMDGVYWTIVLELIFYGWITLAIAARLLPKRTNLVIAMWLALAVLNEFWIDSGGLRILLLTRYAPWFALGMLAHNLWTDLSADRENSNTGTISLALVAMVLSYVAVVNEHLQITTALGTEPAIAGALIGNSVVISLMAAALIFAPRFSRTRLSVVLAGISYPLYLLHQHVGYMILDPLAGHVGSVPALVVTTGSIAILSWIVFWKIEPALRRVVVSAAVPFQQAALFNGIKFGTAERR